MNRVRNGTPNHSQPSKCLSCRMAQRVVGEDMNQDITFCRFGGETVVIRWKVTDCNMYEDKNTPPLWELEKIAWRVSPDNRSNARVGFLSPEDFKKKYPDLD